MQSHATVAEREDLHPVQGLRTARIAELAALAAKHGGTLRVGLLTNQTGLDAHGRRTIDVLAQDAQQAIPGLKLKLIFSPEHGINGTLDKAGIQDSTDPSPGLPVVLSLAEVSGEPSAPGGARLPNSRSTGSAPCSSSCASRASLRRAARIAASEGTRFSKRRSIVPDRPGARRMPS